MSGKSTQRIAAVISLCLIFAIIGVFFGLRQLNAQAAAPGGADKMGAGTLKPPAGVSMAPPGGGGGMMIPGMGGGMGGGQSASAVTETAPTGPMLTLNKIASGIQTKNIKNWDGKFTPMLRFKYKLSSNRVLTVYLPRVIAAEKHTKQGWEAVFQTFAMDKEAIVDAEIKNNPTPQSASSSGGTTGMMGGGMTMPGMPGMPGMGGSIPMLPPMR